MTSQLVSDRYAVDDRDDVEELFHEKGWSDGLPVVPPTEAKVNQHLEAAGLDPGHVVGEMPERGAVITAEKLAINAVMAGCRPEYMPIVVAVIEAVSEPTFKFNHLASLGSPWPLIIVNGPIASEVGLNSGMYVFGPGSRANTTIARAVSLALSNCAEAKVGGIQRGQWGHPGRLSACVAENETTAWVPLHVQKGFDANDSTVTVLSTYPSMPYHVTTVSPDPVRMLDATCHAISGFGGAQWTRGVYALLVGPHHAEAFAEAGWSKDDVRHYLFEHTRASVADLKYRGAWGGPKTDLAPEDQEIQPGDAERYLYLFQDNGDDDGYIFIPSAVEDRECDIQVVVAGGDAGRRLSLCVPYQLSTNPVTKLIRTRSRS